MYNKLKNISPIHMGAFTLSLILVVLFVGDLAFGPQHVTLKSNHWTCTASRPVGIHAECTIYELKR